MKKIMFKDSVGLTKAVLDGRKTQTRRVATYEELPDPFDGWLTEGKDAGKRGGNHKGWCGYHKRHY